MKRSAILLLLPFMALSLILFSYYIFSNAAGEIAERFVAQLPLTVIVGEPSNSRPAITVDKVDLARCRDDQNELTDDYWVLLHLSNPDDDHWVQGSGQFSFHDNLGQPFTSFWFSEGYADTDPYLYSELVVPAGSSIWMVPPETLNRRQTFQLSSISQDVELHWRNVMLREIDGSEKLYKWDTKIISYGNTGKAFPKHWLKVQVSNFGDGTMYRTRIYGAIYDSKDQLVDLAWSEEPGSWPTGTRIKPGESKSIDVVSTALTGRCLGELDPNGYRTQYWIDFLTASGQPLSSHHTYSLTN